MELLGFLVAWNIYEQSYKYSEDSKYSEDRDGLPVIQRSRTPHEEVSLNLGWVTKASLLLASVPIFEGVAFSHAYAAAPTTDASTVSISSFPTVLPGDHAPTTIPNGTLPSEATTANPDHLVERSVKPAFSSPLKGGLETSTLVLTPPAKSTGGAEPVLPVDSD